MSSPNACGGLALLLSGLKAESVAYSPQSVRRAVVNSARQLDPERSDVFSQGAGLLQVDAAYSYLKTNAGKSAAEHVRFQVTVPGRDNARGIYLRDGEAANVAEMTVSVKPIFPEKTTNEVKAEFEMSISLESSQPWLEAPAHLATVNASRSFGVRIDPTELEPGSHYAEIVARDALAPDAGSLFKIPITVLRTVQLDDRFRWRDTVELSSAQIERRFFAVPAGATWVDIKMRAGDLAASRRLVTHVLQQPPQRANGRGFQREYITFESGGEAVRSYPVVGGHTLEWCIGQYWSSLGDSEFELELEFHGLPPSSPDVHLSGGRISTRVEVTAPLANEKIAPTATLDTLRQNYPPSKTQIRRLSAERDRLPNDRQIYELINTYQFSLAATTRVTARTGVSAQSEANLSWQSMLWQIFDVNKRLRASGNSGKSATLAKGVYTLRFHLRSASLAEIKRIEKTPLLLDHRLAKPITLKIHADPDDAVRGSPTFKALNLLSGQRAVLHVAHPSRTSLPKAARGGDELRGRIYFGEESKQDGAGRNPRGYAISYSTPSSSTSTTTSSSRTSSPADYLFQAKMQRLTALREQQKRDDFAALLKEILKEKPNHLPALIENVKIQDDEDRKARLPDVVKACSRVLKRINRKRLASHYGVRLNTTDAKAVQERKKNDEQKKILIDMLYRKGWAVAFMDLPPKPGQPMEIPKRPKNSEARDKLFEETYAELARWIDMSDPQVILLNIRRERRQKRPAAALKLLDKAIAATPLDKRLYQKRADIFGELGWKDWQAVELKRMITRYPDHYPGF
jgi:tripeptidyl-peptidase-2